MTAHQPRYDRATALFDAANAEDPHREIDGDAPLPKELLYARRMSDMLARFAPQADEAMHLAVRAQHIRRWKIPRTTYPATKDGYHQWRSGLYRFHAETAGCLLREAGYDEATVARVAAAIGKRGIKTNPDTQLVEDVASLVFLEHYLAGFAAQHPDYDEARWLGILEKTWRKMSPAGRTFAHTSIRLPELLLPLIRKACT